MLIPFDKMPPERHLELSAKGGRASGEAKRRKRDTMNRLLLEMEKYVLVEEFIDDIEEFNRWKKQRDKARAKRERTT